MQENGQMSVRIKKRLRPLVKAEPHPNTLLNKLLEQYYILQGKL